MRHAKLHCACLLILNAAWDGFRELANGHRKSSQVKLANGHRKSPKYNTLHGIRYLLPHALSAPVVKRAIVARVFRARAQAKGRARKEE